MGISNPLFAGSIDNLMTRNERAKLRVMIIPSSAEIFLVRRVQFPIREFKFIEFFASDSWRLALNLMQNCWLTLKKREEKDIAYKSTF